eukprot:EST48082.1 Hypothetical protein SS50377_11780 [Spironucleus salmonicida]
MKVNYDPNILDYTGLGVFVVYGYKDVKIINADHVHLPFKSDIKDGILVSNVFLQIVNIPESLVDKNKILQCFENNSLLNYNGNKQRYFQNKDDSYIMYKTLILENFNMVEIYTNTRICELNNIKIIDIKSAEKLSTLIINGIKVIFNYSCYINDQKIFEQYPIQVVSIKLLDSQLSLVPDLFLSYCHQIQCHDSCFLNSKRVLDNVLENCDLALGSVSMYTITRKYCRIQCIQFYRISIKNDEQFSISENDYQATGQNLNAQWIRFPLECLETAYQGAIYISRDIQLLKLKHNDSSFNNSVQKLDLTNVTISRLEVPILTNIEAIRINNSFVLQTVFQVSSIQSISYSNIFEAL